MSTGDLTYSMVTIANNLCCILGICKENKLKYSHHTHTKYLCEMIGVTKIIVVIISQYICISNHRVLYLKLTQCLYVNYISIELGKLYQMTMIWDTG